jgi:hypothetical protein
MVQVGSPKYKRGLKILLSYIVSSQFWLNLPMDDPYFGYITKLTPKNIAL